MDDAALREGIGKSLHAAGWRQGTIIRFPFDLHVIMMIHGDRLTTEQFDALGVVEQAIHDKLDSARVQLAPFEFRTDAEMSRAEYPATVPLFFDHLTCRGDEVVGLEPPPPA
jgi:hypothetical protein